MKVKKDFYLFSLIVLIIIGFILRFYKLNIQSLWIDEGFSINAAVQTLKYGYPLLESGFVYSGSLLNTYFIAFFIKLFKDLIFASRLVSVIFGILSIIITFYFGKEIYNKKIGLIAALFVTFSSIEIAWSRQARMYAQFQFFYLLSLYLFYKFINNKSLKYFILALILTISTILSNILGFSLILIYFVYFILNFKDFKFIFTKKFLIPIFVFLIPIGYLIIKNFWNYSYIYINYFLKYIYFLRFSHEILFYFSLVGILVSLKEFKKSSFLFISFIVPILVISFFVFLFHYRYLFFILPILFIFAAYLINFISDYFKKFGLIIMIILTTIVLINGFTFIPRSYYELEALTPQPNFKEAYLFVKENLNDEVIIDSYPVLSEIYLGKVDYGLKFSLTGRDIDIYNESFDVYTNKPFIKFEELSKIKSCYLIIDDLAFERIDNDLKDYIKSMNVVKDLKNVKVLKC